jgi:uncharacterized protein
MERKDFAIELKELDLELGVFEGHASTFGNVDLVGDRVMAGAFRRTLKHWKDRKQPIPILWQHNPSEPIGATLEAREDDEGLYVKGQLILDVAKAREARSLMQAGVLGGLSIGYDVVKDKWNTDGVRDLNEVKLYEYSPVTWAANDQARYTSVKNYSPDDLRRIALELISVSAIERKASRDLTDTERKLAREALVSLQALLDCDTTKGDPADGHSSEEASTDGPGQPTDSTDPALGHSLDEVRSLIADMRKSAGI